MFRPEPFFILSFYPIIIKNASILFGEVINKLMVDSKELEDDVIDQDIILLWGDKNQIITGADILGRLLKGIKRRVESFK